MGIWDFIVGLYYNMVTMPTDGYIASLLIVNNFIIFLILLTVLFVIRYKWSVKKSKVNRLTPTLNSFYYTMLCNDLNVSDDDIKNGYNAIIKKRNDFTTNLSIDVLAKTKHCDNFNHENYTKLIQVLGFDDFLIKKVSFSSAIKKFKALNTIKELEIKSADLSVLPFAFSKNSAVRKEARLSHLLLSENNPYRFFEEVKDDVSYWDSIELISLLEKVNEKGKLENLGKWLLNSENKSLSIFLMKAIGHFKQVASKEVVIEKLSDNDAEVRSIAIETLGVLKVEEVESKLVAMFDNELSVCQTAIIKALRKLNTGNSLTFLESTFHEVSEEKLRTNIANTIFQYQKGGKKLFNKLKKSSDTSRQAILNHIETPLIKFKEYA